jgi:hypothetical protein
MKKKGKKMVPDCVPESTDLIENWVTDLMNRVGSKTINKDKYRKVAQHIKREMGKGKYTSPEFAAADTIRKFSLDIDAKVLAGMIRKLA